MRAVARALGRAVVPVLVLCATLLALHAGPVALGPAPSSAPVVTLQRVPAPALPAVEHCWREPSGEVLSGDPALAVPYSTPVPCSS